MEEKSSIEREHCFTLFLPIDNVRMSDCSVFGTFDHQFLAPLKQNANQKVGFLEAYESFFLKTRMTFSK